jgi:pimeloyl-ACP methyl ester carboxylesterase
LPTARPIDEGRREFINFIKSNHRAAMEAFIESVMPEPSIEHKKRWGVHICLRPGPEVAVRSLELAAEGETDYHFYEIKIPTLTVYGDLDGDYVKESSHYLEKTLPDAKLVVIKGAGHVPIVTRTQEVLNAINHRFGLQMLTI